RAAWRIRRPRRPDPAGRARTYAKARADPDRWRRHRRPRTRAGAGADRPCLDRAGAARQLRRSRCRHSIGAERRARAAAPGAGGPGVGRRRPVAPREGAELVGAAAAGHRQPGRGGGGFGAPGRRVWLSPGVNVVHYPVRGGSEIAAVVIATETWQGTGWETKA